MLRTQFPQKEAYPLKFYFQNLTAGIKQIAEFFGFSLTGEQIQTISAQSTFQAMRAKSQETHGAIGPFLFRKGKVALVSGTSVNLHVIGNTHNFILNKTRFYFSFPQQEVQTLFRAGTGSFTISFRVLSSFSLSACHLEITREQRELWHYIKIKILFYSNKKRKARDRIMYFSWVSSLLRTSQEASLRDFLYIIGRLSLRCWPENVIFFFQAGGHIIIQLKLGFC